MFNWLPEKGVLLRSYLDLLLAVTLLPCFLFFLHSFSLPLESLYLTCVPCLLSDSGQNISSMRMAILFGSKLYPHILESYPVLSKCSVNMCWTNEQMKGAAPGWKESVCCHCFWPPLSWKQVLSQDPPCKSPLCFIGQNWFTWHAPLPHWKVLEIHEQAVTAAPSHPRHQNMLSQEEAGNGYELDNQSYHPQVVQHFITRIFYFYFSFFCLFYFFFFFFKIFILYWSIVD